MKADVLVPLARGYLDSGCVQGMDWLANAVLAVKSNAVEIAQKLLRNDGEGALATWNATDIRWPARAIAETADGAWKISGVGGEELVVQPDRLKDWLLDLARFLVHVVPRGAAILQ